VPFDSELLSRDEIKGLDPGSRLPDILMTNYQMLELLLTRFEDRVLFPEEHAGRLRFLVLDEVHTYTGKRGADVARTLQFKGGGVPIPRMPADHITEADFPGGADTVNKKFNGAGDAGPGTTVVDGGGPRIKPVHVSLIFWGSAWKNDSAKSALTTAVAKIVTGPYLSALGISEYIPLTNLQQRLDPRLLPALWKEDIRQLLDRVAVQLGKPLLLSEIGYRDTQDALYNPWQRDVTEIAQPADPEEQAAAYNAALSNVIVDPHIAGVFFWAWSVPLFAPNWRPAAKVLNRWYTSYLA